MSVTEAADRLGVGRPALSNLLNGNASLSSEMAVRLEKSFGAGRQKLLDMQAAFDRYESRSDEKSIAVGAYVPAFLTIKARHIHGWPDENLEARQLLPVLLRRLVHSTGQELSEVDFPGYDNAERKGNDGLTVAGAATPWIPRGRSCWEFGVSKRPGSKAESDYAARVRSISPTKRQDCTFIFVTPRNWRGKTEWVNNKQASRDWKAVRAYDASDLEQWLEQSIAAQMWFTEILGMENKGFETLDHFWRSWSSASEPSLRQAIFEPSIATHRDTVKKWLESASKRPLLVAADSKGEALAFLACLLRDPAFDAKWGDFAAIFESAQSLRKLESSPAPFIPIVGTEEAEQALATIYRERHCIVVRPRNAVDSNPDIALELLDHDAFEKALATMGIEGDRAERLARESGRSPTIVRRRLSRIGAVKMPEWSRDTDIARRLIPMALIGAWHANSEADRQIVSTLADRPYEEIERGVTGMLGLDDVPVWCTGQYRGVASKIDALFAISRHMTEQDLTEFFWLAEYVLSEMDPALDLPQNERWAAAIHGKVRDHSAALRAGVCETLVLLSVHGDGLFRARLGIDVDAWVSSLIKKLLTPLTIENLLSQQKDLPNYAEAAPESFLELIEADLKKNYPAVLELLKPADSGPFGGCPRSGLLWALECLAWKHIGRVSLILANMSRIVINDNWTNKPINSLAAIYRAWMPQTAASLADRMSALEMLMNQFPDVGWKICMGQLISQTDFATSSHRPRWRSDASGAGQPLDTWEVIDEFTDKALELVLARREQNGDSLFDLVEKVDMFPDDAQEKVWELIDRWANSETDDREKARLGEKIRRFALTSFGQRRGLNDITMDRARKACSHLQSDDAVLKHAWLFTRQRIALNVDGCEDGDDYSLEQHEKIRRLRAVAMVEILAERGFEGVLQTLSDGGIAGLVGDSVALSITNAAERVEFLEKCLSTNGDIERQIDGCVSGFLGCIDDDARGAILSAVATNDKIDRTARVFLCAPVRGVTWRQLDGYRNEIRVRYWREVSPGWNRYSDAELIELTDRLLDAERPLAAFHVVHLDWSRIETSRLKRLLLAVACAKPENEEHHQLDAYYISEALDSLGERNGVSPEEMAQLEFMYIDALRRSKHGIPNLEKQIEESPILFVQALALVFRRNDNGQDPAEWRIEDSHRQANIARAARAFLGQIIRLPGTEDGDSVDDKKLLRWVIEVRRLCAEFGRAAIGDQYIGKLLSRPKDEAKGVWPSSAVCKVMEEIASQEIDRGFIIGVRNARGMHRREKGGVQERKLADKYRNWGNRLAFEFPYVSRVLNDIAVSYDEQAVWQDQRSELENKLWQ